MLIHSLPQLRESAIKQVYNFRVQIEMCSGGNPLILRTSKASQNKTERGIVIAMNTIKAIRFQYFCGYSSILKPQVIVISRLG